MSQGFIAANQTPLLTVDLSGTGGHVYGPEDFIVEEIPAYLPCGAGSHLYVWLEKRGLTTPAAIQRICEALGLDARNAGYAGLKDKHGVTRQWISLEGADPAAIGALQLPGVRILQAALHRNKLRTGHLKGNHFEVLLRGTCADALARAEAIFARLGKQGLANYYGAQRFGASADNAAFGLDVLRGQRRAPRDRRQRRLIASALQSQLFNQALAQRVEEERVLELIDGDVLQRSDSSGQFVSEDRHADQDRLARGEVVITGPMCGPRMMRPREGSEARAWEDALFARFDLGPQDFAAWGRIARGGRRALTVPVHDISARMVADDRMRLEFSLPAGSYASVLLREVAKTTDVLAPRRVSHDTSAA